MMKKVFDATLICGFALMLILLALPMANAEVFIVTGGNMTNISINATYNLSSLNTTLYAPNQYYCRLNEYETLTAEYRNARKEIIGGANLTFIFNGTEYPMEWNDNLSRWELGIMSSTIGILNWTINASGSIGGYVFQNQTKKGYCQVYEPYNLDIYVWQDKNMTVHYINEFAWIIAESTTKHCDNRTDRNITLNGCFFLAPYQTGFARIELFEPIDNYKFYIVEGVLTQNEPYTLPMVSESQNTLVRNWYSLGTYNVTSNTHRLDLLETNINLAQSGMIFDYLILGLKLFTALVVFIFVFYISGDLVTALLVAGGIIVAMFGLGLL
jgi:hypothetical protein